ncbi:MAG: peptidase domain-containing ABC transporter [Chryseolinea sp.]
MSIKVKQHDMTDCGAACIASISAYYKLMLPVSRIRQLASTDRKGTSVMGLLEALSKLGFEAKGVRGDLHSLFNVPKPAIAHIMPVNGLHHYIVIYGASNNLIEVMDPADGHIHHYTHDDFLKVWTGVMVILQPGKAFQTGNHKVPNWQRFWQLVSPQKSLMAQALTGAAIFTLIGLSTSIYVQKIVDYVLVEGNSNLLNLMSMVMIALLIVQTFIGITKGAMMLQTGQQIDAQLILGYYKHVLRLPQAFFDSMRIGEITSRVSDAMKIRIFINDAAIAVAVNIFIIILSFALMFTYYWKLALIILLVIPFYVIIYWVANRVNKKVERKLMENAADLEAQLVESLSAVGTIKSFAVENYADRKTETSFIALLGSVQKSGMNSILTGGGAEFIARLFTIILLWVGAGFVLQNAITPGELLSFYALIAYFTGPAGMLIGMNKVVQNAVIAADRLFEIMDLEQESSNDKITLTPEAMGDIMFRNVHFTYGAAVTVFANFNLHIPVGKTCAIVGESGSGKSTLISILQNIYPIQRGHVLIGKCDVKYIEHASLRKCISIVPQKIDLFSGNIIENIALGVVEPDFGRIMSICSALNILEFIENLPQGFHTSVGENGSTLSGGQRQRIAIARALYTNPELLILDEATSALDTGAEQYVHRMIEVMRMRKKTVIIVAHRISTIFRADKIVVLHNGVVAEEGRHDELLNNKQKYYDMWKQQFAVVENLS